MSKSKIITIVLISCVLIAFWLVVKNSFNKTDLMINPIGKQAIQEETLPSNTPIPAATPKTFKFDSSTDLKKELDQINPQVLDSDFE